MSTCISSGDIGSNTQVYTGRGTLNSVVATATDTNNATVEVFDSATGDNTQKLLASIKVSGGSNRTQEITFSNPVRCLHGLYVEVSGTPDRLVVYYGAC